MEKTRREARLLGLGFLEIAEPLILPKWESVED